MGAWGVEMAFAVQCVYVCNSWDTHTSIGCWSCSDDKKTSFESKSIFNGLGVPEGVDCKIRKIRIEREGGRGVSKKGTHDGQTMDPHTNLPRD